MKLSIIIPVNNEEKCVAQTIEKISKVLLPVEKEIVIVNDGSTDKTFKILEELKSIYNFKLINLEKNQGKGHAIKSGLKEITGNYLLIQDADLEYDPIDIPKLLGKIDKNTSAVYGNRGIKKWPKKGYHYILGAKMLTTLINILFKTKLKDVYTGYKLFNLEKINLQNLTSSGFEFEAEVTCKILKNKGKIVETNISYNPRNKKEGKKIKLKDALKGLLTIVKNRLGLDF